MKLLSYLGRSAVSGVLGWAVLMGAFEAAYWGEAYLAHWKRGR